MIISILICSLYERAAMLSKLLRELYIQIEENNASDKVEILTFIDSKELTTGAKRNKLYTDATGKYSMSIDDDDWIPHYFISELLKAAESDADCFSICGTITTNGQDEKEWYISIHYSYCAKIVNSKEIYLRYPNHITPIKTEIARQVKFPEQTIGEDYVFATELHNKGLLKTECKISKPMYFYHFITNK